LFLLLGRFFWRRLLGAAFQRSAGAHRGKHGKTEDSFQHGDLPGRRDYKA
jgi:hypothetical protein